MFDALLLVMPWRVVCVEVVWVNVCTVLSTVLVNLQQSRYLMLIFVSTEICRINVSSRLR